MVVRIRQDISNIYNTVSGDGRCSLNHGGYYHPANSHASFMTANSWPSSGPEALGSHY